MPVGTLATQPSLVVFWLVLTGCLRSQGHVHYERVVGEFLGAVLQAERADGAGR